MLTPTYGLLVDIKSPDPIFQRKDILIQIRTVVPRESDKFRVVASTLSSAVEVYDPFAEALDE